MLRSQPFLPIKSAGGVWGVVGIKSSSSHHSALDRTDRARLGAAGTFVFIGGLAASL